MIQAIILTRNEEKSIKRCLKSLSWCNKIIIIDDFSKDKTVSMAKKLKAKVFRRKLANNFSSQRNFGLKKAGSDWVLFLDADELMTKALEKEIKGYVLTSRHQGINGFYLKRKDKFMGRWLKHGETAAVKLLRLAKRDAGIWKGQAHEAWEVKGKLKTLKQPLLHVRDINIGQFIKRIDKYSNLRAEELYNKGINTNLFSIIAFPLGKFFQNYFIRLGFLDGFPGFAMAFMMGLHSFLVRAKLYLKRQQKASNKVISIRFTNLIFIFWVILILLLYFFQLIYRGIPFLF